MAKKRKLHRMYVEFELPPCPVTGTMLTQAEARAEVKAAIKECVGYVNAGPERCKVVAMQRPVAKR